MSPDWSGVCVGGLQEGGRLPERWWGMDKLEHVQRLWPLSRMSLRGPHNKSCHVQRRAQSYEPDWEAPTSQPSPAGWPYRVTGAESGLCTVQQDTGLVSCENRKPGPNATLRRTRAWGQKGKDPKEMPRKNHMNEKKQPMGL